MKRSRKIISTPISPTDARRIQITLQCKDTESLPRVPGAGGIYAGENERYQLMHNGIKVIENGYIGSWVTELIRLLKGFHEPQEEKAFAEILSYIPAHATMLELGSWWSYYSLWFQKEIPDSRNYMIEPDINNLMVGMKNFELNNMDGHHLNAAIGKQSIGSIPYRCYESDNIERPVPVYSVDDFLERESVQLVDLLLADIQGYELEMLQGATKSIQKGAIRFMVISTHHHAISHDPLIHQKCLEFLKKCSAKILVEHTVSESFSGDGLIVASLSSKDQNLPTIEISRNFPRGNLFRETENDLSELINEQQGLATTLNTKEVERQGLAAALGAKEAERQQLEAERRQLEANLNAKELERQGLAADLDSKLADHQQLAAALNAKEAGLQKLEAALNAKEVERLGLVSALGVKEAERQRLEAALNAKEVERKGLVSALDAKDAERQRLIAAMKNKEAEQQRLATALDAKKVEQQGLVSALNAKEAERQRLEAVLNSKEIEQKRFAAALNAKEAERQGLEAALKARVVEKQELAATLYVKEAERLSLETILNAKVANQQQLNTKGDLWEAERKGLESALNAKEAERQKLEAALDLQEAERFRLVSAMNAKEVEWQRLEAALYAKELERQALDNALNAKEAERQQMESALNAKVAVQQQRLDAALKAIVAERQGLDAALNAKEAERQKLESALKALKSQMDIVQANRDLVFNELIDVYHSRSFQLTKPLRLIFIAARKSANKLKGLPDQSVLAASSGQGYKISRSRRIVNDLRGIPWIAILLDKFKYRNPRLYYKISRQIKQRTRTQPVLLPPLQMVASDPLALNADESRFLKLFERELSSRQAKK